MNILDIIVHHKIKQVAERKVKTPLDVLKQSKYYQRDTFSLSQFITSADRSGVIAEFKRKSPSKPEINLKADVEVITSGYNRVKASGLSVLTDEEFFGGGSEYLQKARAVNDIPVLRKDFIIDAYQVHEAKSIGADAILLIAEILTKVQVNELSAVANGLGLEVLMELHDVSQVNKISPYVNVVGVNNRDLKTFKTSIQSSLDIIELLPDVCKISESGIHTVDQMLELNAAGYDGFLIGEKFMANDDPVAACSNLINEYLFKRK